jgi:hypothetical protein
MEMKERNIREIEEQLLQKQVLSKQREEQLRQQLEEKKKAMSDSLKQKQVLQS